jgi:hypothetical protein
MSSQVTPLEQRVSPIHRFAGAASAALGRVRGAPAWAMTIDEQAETLRELDAVLAGVTALHLEVLAAADRNDIGDKIGATSTAAWLAAETRQTRAHCHARLRLARALDNPVFEVTRTALAAGALTVEQARVIVAAVEDLPAAEVSDDDRARAQHHLVGLAAEHDAKLLRVFARRLFEVIAPEEADRREGEALAAQERRARERCGFGMRDNGDGTASGTFKLPVAQAQMLSKALQAHAAPRRTDPTEAVDADGNRLPYRVLLGRAFADLVEHLPLDRLPQAGGTAATVVVSTTLDALRAGIGAASLDTGERLSPGQARRLACGAGLIPAVLGTDSVPLDLGRRARLFNRHQRLALDLRDGGCTAAGCDRPAAWCEAHHDQPWSRGGPTDLAEGRLLCPHHHHLAHDDRYQAERLPDNRIRFHRRP